ncbi:oligoendopeptidase F [Kordiimonas aestuarii]|uniref:oligoendopeptidase F n=1 Tax=Kordiimonas aestuarii TaxID=1005925 RepID=UPI0021D3E49A|nr:oligoendopeptidase F [Kordiimonas aestuarii]
MGITKSFKRSFIALAASTALMTAALAPTQATLADDAAKIEWDLTDLYADPAAWDAERQRVLSEMKEIEKFKGKLGQDAKTLLAAADKISKLQKEAVRLLVYAVLAADEDLRVSEKQEHRTLAQSLLSSLSQATAFVSPELIKVGSKKIEKFIAKEPGLEKHAFALRDTLRQEKYTLGEEAESVLANAGDVLSGPGQIYGLMTNASLPWPTATLSTGEEVMLNQSAYSKYRAVGNRDDRKLVFDTFWGAWKTYEAMFGATLSTHVQGHIFTAKSRGYDNALESAVSGSNIPTAVYRALVKAANDNLPSMHRYLKLRQRLLGLDDLHYYDIYPEVTQLDRTFTIDDAKEMTLVSLEPFGEKYLSHLRKGFEGQWMHVFPQQGKRPGAYMFGSAYDVHPYLLLNYNSGFEDVSTFSHEWGHAVHTMLSRENQPYENFSYTTFTAELASTTNEVLLQEHMLAKDLPDAERLYYIDRALEGIRGTFFRQTMFAEFELRIHEMAEKGEALSGKKMTELYLELLRKYHGEEEGVMQIDDTYGVEWAYIPHFYRNFYVYQYATSISGGTAFAERMLAGDDTARDDYIRVLEAGGSEYPYELLKSAKIDLASEVPYTTLINRMNRLMDEAEKILDRMGK